MLQVFLVPVRTITAVFSSIHSQTDDVGLPFLVELPETVFIDIIREPGQSVGADPTQLDRVSAFVNKLCPVYMESAVDRRPRRA